MLWLNRVANLHPSPELSTVWISSTFHEKLLACQIQHVAIRVAGSPRGRGGEREGERGVCQLSCLN